MTRGARRVLSRFLPAFGVLASLGLGGCVGPIGDEGADATSQRISNAVSSALGGMEVQVSLRLDGLARDLDVALYPDPPAISASQIRAALRAIVQTMPRDVAAIDLSAWDLESGALEIEEAAVGAGIRPGDVRDGVLITVVDTPWLVEAFGG